MSLLGWIQLLADFFFLFMILVLLVGRSWRRGAAGRPGDEEQESYRAMVSTLSEIIKTVKDTVGEAQDRMTEKQAEIQASLAAADERLRRLKEENDRAQAGVGRGPAVPERPVPAQPPLQEQPRFNEQPAPVSQTAAEAPKRGVDSEASGEAREGKEEERRAKYQQALEFMEKGWSALDIARFTHLPRGEVELLMRTKGKKV